MEGKVMNSLLMIMTTLSMACGFGLAPLVELLQPPPAMTAMAVTEPDPADVEALAIGIYQEAGGDACSDQTRMCVGDVILNRVADRRFPGSIVAVLTAPGQYGRLSTTGLIWPERANDPGEAAAVERAYEIARLLLSGNHGDLWGQGYVWQAEFEQGIEGFWLDGIYFGR